ncbi:putative F-box domain-containing protein [Tanacetum coccineum]
MSDNIPFEMQAEIIKRLPVKSLLRFRSVSKPWKFFIDSPKLTSSYGIHHTKSHRLFTKYLDAVGSKENYVSFVDDDTFAQQMFTHTVPTLAKLLQNLKVIGCSQSLLCMHGHFRNNSGRKNMVVLWNMSIRKSISIVCLTEQLTNFIMSFDMTSKEFEVVDLPDSLAQSFYIDDRLV